MLVEDTPTPPAVGHRPSALPHSRGYASRPWRRDLSLRGNLGFVRGAPLALHDLGVRGAVGWNLVDALVYVGVDEGWLGSRKMAMGSSPRWTLSICSLRTRRIITTPRSE